MITVVSKTETIMNGFTNLIIEQTPKTPQIELNMFTGDLIFTGRSTPENADKIYEPVLNWTSQYIQKARSTTNVRLNLDYFNTASALWLAKILKMLVRINEPDYVLVVHLYLPVEEFDKINGFDDIKDAFIPIADIFHGTINGLGIKLYGTDEKGKTIMETMIFFEEDQFLDLNHLATAF
jgi:hypothetical protein